MELPCVKEQRINNSINAPKAEQLKRAKGKGKKEKQNGGENFVTSLKDAQAKAAIIHQK